MSTLTSKKRNGFRVFATKRMRATISIAILMALLPDSIIAQQSISSPSFKPRAIAYAERQPDADCYPGAPPQLQKVAQDIATVTLREFIRDRDPDVAVLFNDLLIYTLAHAFASPAVVEKRKQVTQVREETKRTDKQIGASPGSDGSTSAAEKPGFVDLLGLAVETGAIQQNVNGTTLTLSTSPYAFVVAARGDTAETYKKYDGLNRIGISANFKIDDQDMVLANARRKQLQQWSIRFRFTPDRSTRSQEFENFWAKEVRPKLDRFAITLTGELSTIFQREVEATRRDVLTRFIGLGNGAIKNYLTANASKTDRTNDEKIIEDVKNMILCFMKTEVFDKADSFNLDDQTKERLVNETVPSLLAAALSIKEADNLAQEKIDELDGKPLASLVYTNVRQEMGSDYSVVKFLFEKKSFSPFKVVANASISFYHHPNQMMNQESVRDFEIALSLEGSLGRSPFLNEGAEIDQSQIALSFTGNYRRLLENRGVADKKADLGVVQLKLEVPAFTGMSFPFSVTYATATDLIKEDHVRANFGVSFDLDKLFSVRKLLKR